MALGTEGLELARQTGDKEAQRRSLALVGPIAHEQGDVVRAKALLKASVPLVDTVRGTASSVWPTMGFLLYYLGSLALLAVRVF
jgi:hypothetical protein